MKLKAFTLVETLVVLVLTGLLITFCIYAYLIIKQHEKILTSGNRYSTDISLAAEKITDLTYQSGLIRWRYPKLIFETDRVLGILKFNVDSLDVLNAKEELLTRIPMQQYSVDTLEIGNEWMAKGFFFKVPRVSWAFVFHKEYPMDLKVNERIPWRD